LQKPWQIRHGFFVALRQFLTSDKKVFIIQAVLGSQGRLLRLHKTVRFGTLLGNVLRRLAPGPEQISFERPSSFASPERTFA
jgi:hypothetical protein